MNHPPLVRKSLGLASGHWKRRAITVTRWVTPSLRKDDRGYKHFGMFVQGSVLFEVGDHVSYHLPPRDGKPQCSTRSIGCIVDLVQDGKSGMVVVIQPFMTKDGTITSIDGDRTVPVSPGTNTVCTTCHLV